MAFAAFVYFLVLFIFFLFRSFLTFFCIYIFIIYYEKNRYMYVHNKLSPITNGALNLILHLVSI